MTFNIGLKDLLENDPSVISREITKYTPGGLTTSWSKSGRSTGNLNMFNLSEILQRLPAFNGELEVQQSLEALVSGTMGGFFDKLKDAGSLASALIPGDLRAIFDTVEPDDEFGGDGGDFDDGSGRNTGGNLPPGSADASQVISLAKSYIDVGERPPGSNNTIFHDMTGYPPDLWCMTFLVAIFKQAGIPSSFLHPSTETSRSRFINAGRWGSTPRLGAIAFFKFSNRNANVTHGALVTRWEGTSVTTIDGNTSKTGGGSQDNGGWVAEKTRSKNIVGYGYPYYGDGGRAGGGGGGSGSPSSIR